MESSHNTSVPSDFGKAIDAVKALVASSALFLPVKIRLILRILTHIRLFQASLPHREVLTESAFSISQLIGHVYDSINNAQKLRSPFDST